MIDTTFSLYALFAANALMLAAAVLAILRFQRMCQESADFWNSPSGSAIHMDSPTRKEHSERVVHEIEVLQKLVAKLCESEGPRAQSLPGKLPLRRAVRMAKSGASIEDLTKGCGLNIGEARLMKTIHGGHVAANVAAES